MEMIVPVVMVNVAVVSPAGTLTESGTVSTVALVPNSETLIPPAGAALDMVTVHTDEEFGPRALGLHCREERLGGDSSESVNCTVEPFEVADTVTL